MSAAPMQPMPRAPSRTRRASWVRLGLRLVAAFLAVWLVASFVAERTSLHPPRRGIGPTPAAMGMAYRDVSFKTRDGLTLRGWWIPGTRHESIVMIHGLSNSRQEPLAKAGYLHEAGYNLLVFDLRGHGQSDGEGTTMGFREPEDARAAVAEARALDPGPIALFGYSLGASIAVEEAAVNPDVNAVVEDSGFSSVGEVFMARFSEVTHLPNMPWAAPLLAFGQLDVGTSLWNVQPVAQAALLDKPLLAIIGGADTIVPPVEGMAIFRAAAGPKQFLVVPGAGHVAAYNTANGKYERTVLDFLASSLEGG